MESFANLYDVVVIWTFIASAVFVGVWMNK